MREYVSLRRGQTPAWEELADLAQQLGPGAALVEFVTLEDEAAAYVLRAGWEAPRVFVLPLSRQRLLSRYLRSYENEVLNPVPNRTPRRAWMELGQELLEPIMPALAGVELVVFIPHGWLHTLPLHALTVSAGEPFCGLWQLSMLLPRRFWRAC